MNIQGLLAVVDLEELSIHVRSICRFEVYFMAMLFRKCGVVF
jgi:hypothetical protein